MDVLMLGRCSHEFSWPRRGTDGDYYQVCLLCAAEYKYDWATMRRTERVEHTKPETGIRRSHTREKRPSWVPRARRLKLDIPLRYRVNKTSTWYEGIIENISQSGVLFNGPQQLPVNALIEMVFEMPEEISGQKNSNVVCQGRVMRAKDAPQTGRKSRPGGLHRRLQIHPLARPVFDRASPRFHVDRLPTPPRARAFTSARKPLKHLNCIGTGVGLTLSPLKCQESSMKTQFHSRVSSFVLAQCWFWLSGARKKPDDAKVSSDIQNKVQPGFGTLHKATHGASQQRGRDARGDSG